VYIVVLGLGLGINRDCFRTIIIRRTRCVSRRQEPTFTQKAD